MCFFSFMLFAICAKTYHVNKALHCLFTHLCVNISGISAVIDIY